MLFINAAAAPGTPGASYKPVTQQLAEALGVSPEAAQSMKASFFAQDRDDDDEEDHGGCACLAL